MVQSDERGTLLQRAHSRRARPALLAVVILAATLVAVVTLSVLDSRESGPSELIYDPKAFAPHDDVDWDVLQNAFQPVPRVVTAREHHIASLQRSLSLLGRLERRTYGKERVQVERLEHGARALLKTAQLRSMGTQQLTGKFDTNIERMVTKTVPDFLKSLQNEAHRRDVRAPASSDKATQSDHLVGNNNQDVEDRFVKDRVIIKHGGAAADHIDGEEVETRSYNDASPKSLGGAAADGAVLGAGGGHPQQEKPGYGSMVDAIKKALQPTEEEKKQAAAEAREERYKAVMARAKARFAAEHKAEEDAAAKKKAEEEAAAKKKAEEEAAAKKKAEEEAAAKKKAEEEAAAKKKAEEEAAAKKKAGEEAAAKKKAGEEADEKENRDMLDDVQKWLSEIGEDLSAFLGLDEMIGDGSRPETTAEVVTTQPATQSTTVPPTPEPQQEAPTPEPKQEASTPAATTEALTTPAETKSSNSTDINNKEESQWFSNAVDAVVNFFADEKVGVPKFHESTQNSIQRYHWGRQHGPSDDFVKIHKFNEDPTESVQRYKWGKAVAANPALKKLFGSPRVFDKVFATGESNPGAPELTAEEKAKIKQLAAAMKAYQAQQQQQQQQDAGVAGKHAPVAKHPMASKQSQQLRHLTPSQKFDHAVDSINQAVEDLAKRHFQA